MYFQMLQSDSIDSPTTNKKSVELANENCSIAVYLNFCLLADAEKYCWGEYTSWGENYAGSSSLVASPKSGYNHLMKERTATVSGA